jgi:hypothetical protein
MFFTCFSHAFHMFFTCLSCSQQQLLRFNVSGNGAPFFVGPAGTLSWVNLFVMICLVVELQGLYSSWL